ncbi:protein-tyrosine phosphatase-like protein, partial [Kockovaella imperatae]
MVTLSGKFSRWISSNTVDEEMHYMPFAQDYGPLNLAYTFKACLMIHEKYRVNKLKTVCVYTLPNSRRKANIALMVSLYFLIVWHWQPSAAFAPLAHMEFRLFRDASSGQMDFGLSIQDILWGVYKAINFDLLDLEHFDPRYYRYYETVDNGDLNILGPFIPFASPMDPKWIEASRSEKNKHAEDIDKAASLTKSLIETAQNRRHAYRCILEVFQEQLVGLVVRLNEDLYDRKTFLEFGMEHVDLYFDDGSNPTDEIVERFIGMAEEFIERRRQKVAVHCKAGLGRTGVLIGAYLIYKYQFTATEVIGYMRLVRPGMVVGPQQQYMVENQMKWAGW